jgi:hypothetical protein
MAKLRSFSIAGVEMWFWSKDHNPPHFHAKVEGAWEVQVYFLEAPGGAMFRFKWQKRPFLGRHRKALAQQAAAHRFELLQEWQQKTQAE